MGLLVLNAELGPGMASAADELLVLNAELGPGLAGAADELLVQLVLAVAREVSEHGDGAALAAVPQHSLGTVTEIIKYQFKKKRCSVF